MAKTKNLCLSLLLQSQQLYTKIWINLYRDQLKPLGTNFSSKRQKIGSFRQIVERYFQHKTDCNHEEVYNGYPITTILYL